jgi:hypothetical protein
LADDVLIRHIPDKARKDYSRPMYSTDYHQQRDHCPSRPV